MSLLGLINPEPSVEIERSRLDSLLFNLSALAALLCTYVLSIQDVGWILTIKQILLVILPVILGFRILFLKKLNFWHIVTALIVVGYFWLTKRSSVLAEFILLSWCMLSCSYGSYRSITRQKVFLAGLCLSFIVGLHFIFFEKYDRESIGGLDPNYTSFLVFILFPFALRSRSIVLHVALTGLGLMTHSRAFILAIAFYYAGLLVTKIFSNFKFEYRKYIWGLVAFFILLLGYSYYGYSIGASAYGPDRYGFERLIHIFNNPSDYPRWKANITYFENSIIDPHFFIFGMEPLQYLKEVYIYLPHNVILLELATHGIFLGVIFLTIFNGVVKRVYNPTYFPFFAGILIFWFFLGIEVGAVYNVFLIHSLIILKNVET